MHTRTFASFATRLALALCATASLGTAALAEVPILLRGFNTRGTDIVATPDGGFFLVGVRRTPGEGGSQPLVAKVGADMAPKWVKAFPRKGHFHPTTGAALTSGGVVLAGEASPGDEASHFWAMAVDVKGKQLWTLTVGPKGKNLVPEGEPGSYEATAVVGATDGGAWIGGEVRVAGLTQGLVVRVDKRGKPVISAHFGTAGKHDVILQLIADGEGVLALVRQNAQPNLVTPEGVYLQALNAKGELGARIDFTPNVDTFDEPLGVSKLPDGRWMMFGKGSWVAVFGPDGARQWLREYRERSSVEFAAAVMDGDGFVAVGRIEEGRVRLVGANSDGLRSFDRELKRDDEQNQEAGGIARLSDGRIVFASTVGAEDGDFALPQVVKRGPSELPATADLPRCAAGTRLAETEDASFQRRALVCLKGDVTVGDRVVMHPSPTIAEAIITPGDRLIRLVMGREAGRADLSYAVPGRAFFHFGPIEGDLAVVNGEAMYPKSIFHAGSGVWIERYPNGDAHMSAHLKAGVANGPFQHHYKNGQLAETGAFVDGLPDGEWTRFDWNGKELGRFTLSRGTGTIIEWDSRGQKSGAIEVRNGKLHGWELSWLRGALIWAVCNRDGVEAIRERLDTGSDAELAALKAKTTCP